ncbi:MAG: hypothetical protein Q9166_005346 [cf. Caloplaca sp. 2 TL-2023]
MLYLSSILTALPTIPTTAKEPSRLLTTSPVQCVDSNEWLAPNFVKEDCYVAVQNLYKWDYRFNPDNLMTFFSGGFAPVHRTQMVQTPRRYVESDSTYQAFSRTATQRATKLRIARSTMLRGRWRSGVYRRVRIQVELGGG